MPSIDEIFSGNTLKAVDLGEREPTVTIESVTPKTFEQNGKKSQKLVLMFEGKTKGLVCNKVNAERIAYSHGKDYTQWIGKRITLYVDPFVQFGDKLVPAIRVKPPEARAPQPRPANQVTSGPQPMPKPMPMPAADDFSSAPDFQADEEIPF